MLNKSQVFSLSLKTRVRLEPGGEGGRDQRIPMSSSSSSSSSSRLIQFNSIHSDSYLHFPSDQINLNHVSVISCFLLLFIQFRSMRSHIALINNIADTFIEFNFSYIHLIQVLIHQITHQILLYLHSLPVSFNFIIAGSQRTGDFSNPNH